MWLLRRAVGHTGEVRCPHRPFGPHEAALLRRTIHPTRDGANATPLLVTPADNPGLRVEPEFCSEHEADAIIKEGREILQQFGVSHIAAQHRSFYQQQMQHLAFPNEVNMLRVTGRPERQPWMPEQQRQPGWGYGATLRPEKLPPPIKVLADRLAQSPHFGLGPLRDVTLNYRRGHFFRLDPHLDPATDGRNVFIIGFLSPQVLSLTTAGPPQSVTMDQRQVGAHSWRPGEDIDALMQPRTLVHLSGRARDELKHGVRIGVDARQLKALGVEPPPAPPGCLFDWFGSNRSPIARGEERLSVVFAFADKGETFDEREVGYA